MTTLLEDWALVADGPPLPGTRACLTPVRTRDGRNALLKQGSRSTVEHLALTRWDGVGAVRLLRADPHRAALLVERVDGGTLDGHWDLQACEIVAALYPLLHRPTGAPFPALSARTLEAAAALSALPRTAQLPPRLVEQAASLARNLAADERTDGVLVHGDLQFDHVVGQEGSWRVVSPDPLSGDPAYEVAPLLWHRYDELAGDVRDGLRRRFHTTIDAAGFEEERARDWVIVRAMTRALTADAEGRTRCIAVAKAVQD
jgi:streptomycin 6-kinase